MGIALDFIDASLTQEKSPLPPPSSIHHRFHQLDQQYIQKYLNYYSLRRQTLSREERIISPKIQNTT